MVFLEKIILEHYQFVVVFIAFTVYTYKFLIKRLQLQNEKLVIEEFYKNENAKRIYLEKSKIHIDKYTYNLIEEKTNPQKERVNTYYRTQKKS